MSQLAAQNPDMVDNWRYWCFISYRHADNMERDRQWASWLQTEIERYEVPAELVGTKNLRGDTIPAQIDPVFRDEESLSANSNLAISIATALDRTRILIVLCSPRSVASTYVDQEIRHFKKSGGKDRIVAAIIDGDPDDPSHPCFPLALRHSVDIAGSLDSKVVEEHIAADFRIKVGRFRSEGYTSAEAYRLSLIDTDRFTRDEVEKLADTYVGQLQLMKLKIIAGILGVSLERLRDRDKIHQLELARKRARILRRWIALVGV